MGTIKNTGKATKTYRTIPTVLPEKRGNTIAINEYIKYLKLSFLYTAINNDRKLTDANQSIK